MPVGFLFNLPGTAAKRLPSFKSTMVYVCASLLSLAKYKGTDDNVI